MQLQILKVRSHLAPAFFEKALFTVSSPIFHGLVVSPQIGFGESINFSDFLVANTIFFVALAHGFPSYGDLFFIDIFWAIQSELVYFY
ncbi:MAG: hypothetical protein PVF56_06345 [Desulfobacterales bacterium]|jgi:hypothetical protein